MFWERFLTLCRKASIAPNTLAKELDISSSNVTFWKSGGRPSIDVVLKIARYFDVTTDYLLGATDDANDALLPVVGDVAAGIPVIALSEVTDYVLSTKTVTADVPYTALRIDGKSMEPLLHDGDIVIVRVQPTAETGDIVIAFVGEEEATCKKIGFSAKGITLYPLNPAFEPIFIPKDDVENFRIFGIVTEFRHQLHA